MDAVSLRRGIARLIRTHSSAFASEILNSGFKCMRCGWCCRENFRIRITSNISRPSNAISIFPDDIRCIIKGTGLKWDEIAQPDIYSCLSDGDDIWAIGWILRRNDTGECTFYEKNECTIYKWRPLICRCYPLFVNMQGVEVMHCKGLGNKITGKRAEKMAKMLKRYEIKKLMSYIGIIKQIGDKLKFANLHPLPEDYSGEILVCDGKAMSRVQSGFKCKCDVKC